MLNITIFIKFHKEINLSIFLSFDSAIKDPNGVVNNVLIIVYFH